ncbi:NADH-quinone oxidoreductase subunit F 2 [Sulfobacillus acidophilus TPY]|nr:NADH-quinone oxidoreductase subunit F 2 [Sulfobacillus acidophilus TPY]
MTDPKNSSTPDVQALLADLPPERTYLLPALWRLMEHDGCLTESRLLALSQVMNIPAADVYGVASFYQLFRWDEASPVRIHVCDDVMCRLAGSETLIARLKDEAIGDVIPSPCLGRCDQAPAALVNWQPLPHATVDAIRAKARPEGGSS